MGRSVQAYDAQGGKVWEAVYDIYGGLRNIEGGKGFIPFRQAGQYEDNETGLYYNRFRYYSPQTGSYLSKDPIGLLRNNPNAYAYTYDSNVEIDLFGLSKSEYTPNAWNEFQKDHKGTFDSTKKASEAYNDLKANKSPWPYGYAPKDDVLKPGEKIRMAMSEGQPIDRPGGWATKDEIPDVKTVREKLAVTKEFKEKVSYVQEYEVIKEIPVKTGPVGPQIDGVTGEYLKGGGNQIQMNVPPPERMDYLKPTKTTDIK
ncbi:RHS repeat-associated core domain-containing protein [Apibacter raozihei]|uniref:RHS repeat domain-containing protein n=1 Tax=Apibacter raozihei TaxID=2500547 RepID=UPI000FE43247|nr:RHS repeat-associated core domain-containing protein [Apibacter raozihei]